MSSGSGLPHGKIVDETSGGPFVAVSPPDPRWPLLNRWSQRSPAAIHPPTVSLSSESQKRIGPSSVVSLSPPSDGPAPVTAVGASSDDSQRVVVVTDSRDPSWPGLTRGKKPPLEVKDSSLASVESTRAIPLAGSAPLTAVDPSTRAALSTPAGSEPPILTDVAAKDVQISHGSSAPNVTMNPDLDASGPPIQPPLRGAWAKKLGFTNPSGSQHPGREAHYQKKSSS